MTVTQGSASEMVSTPLFDPETFFQERRTPSLLPAALVVATVGALFGLSAILLAIPELVSLPLILIAGIVVSAVGIPLVWVIETLILYFVSRIFNGEGTFRQLLTYVGWGYFPQIFSAFSSIVIYGYLLYRGTAPSVTDPHILQRALDLLYLITNLWMGYIWIYAVRVAQNLTFGQAVVTAMIPIGFNLVTALLISI